MNPLGAILIAATSYFAAYLLTNRTETIQRWSYAITMFSASMIFWAMLPASA